MLENTQHLKKIRHPFSETRLFTNKVNSSKIVDLVWKPVLNRASSNCILLPPLLSKVLQSILYYSIVKKMFVSYFSAFIASFFCSKENCVFFTFIQSLTSFSVLLCKIAKPFSKVVQLKLAHRRLHLSIRNEPLYGYYINVTFR